MIIYGGGKSGRIHRNVQPTDGKEKAEPVQVCKECGIERPLSQFSKKAGSARRSKTCKKCVAKRERENRAYRNKRGSACIIRDTVTGEEIIYPSAEAAAAGTRCSMVAVRERLRGFRKSPIFGRYELRADDRA